MAYTLLWWVCILGFLSGNEPPPSGPEGPEPVSIPAPPGLTPSVTLGALEVIGVGAGVEGHMGAYATMAVGVSIPIAGPLALIPSVGLEFCPEFGNWGGTFYLTFSVLLHEGQGFLVTLDPYVGLIHDAVPGEGAFEHNFLLGGGAGVSLAVGRTTFSPSLGVYADVEGEGVVLAPTFLFSVSF